MTRNLDVKFFGDLILPEPPASLEDAIVLSQEIPSLCEESKSAVTFSIVPLDDYCGAQEKILNKITAQNIEKEHFHQLCLQFLYCNAKIANFRQISPVTVTCTLLGVTSCFHLHF